MACQASPDAATPLPSLARPARQVPLLTRHDLAPLLWHTHQPTGNVSNQAYQGFFGPAHRRIEMAFREVRRDPAQPATYAVQGKIRYRGIVTPFAGTITFGQVVEQPRYVPQPETEDDGDFFYPGTGTTCNDCPMYTAIGQFTFREVPNTRHYGTYHGRVALDWLVPPTGSALRVEYRTDGTLTRGGGIRFDGHWQDDSTHLTRLVTWVQDIEGFANNGAAPLPELVQNGGDPYYHPRYAHLGWAGHLREATGHWWTK